MRQLKSSDDANEVLRIIWNDAMQHHETFYILLINRANRILGWYKASEGGTAGTVADPRMIFSVALKCNACSIILAHNHPSGNTKPSESDITLTRNFVQAGKLLQINVLDHLILTSETYFSFADEGLI